MRFAVYFLALARHSAPRIGRKCFFSLPVEESQVRDFFTDLRKPLANSTLKQEMIMNGICCVFLRQLATVPDRPQVFFLTPCRGVSGPCFFHEPQEIFGKQHPQTKNGHALLLVPGLCLAVLGLCLGCVWVVPG